MAVKRLLSQKLLYKFVILVPFIWFCIVTMLLFSNGGGTPPVDLNKPNELKQYQIAHAHGGKLAMHVPDHGDAQYFYKHEMVVVDQVENDNNDVNDIMHGEEIIGHDVKQRRDDFDDVNFDNSEGLVVETEMKNNREDDDTNGKDMANKQDDDDDDGDNDDEHGGDGEEGLNRYEDNELPNQDIHEFEGADLKLDLGPTKDQDQGAGNNEHSADETNKHGENMVNIDDEKPQLEEDNARVYENKSQRQNKNDAETSRAEDKTRSQRGPHAKEANIKWPHVPLEGLGENGISVNLEPNTPEEINEKKEGYAKHDFNQFLSDRISVRRNISDNRLPECKSLVYPESMPDTSVVIIFHNEAWTTLLRTVHSVLDRTPARLLKEIILVDDYSDFDFLKRPLEAYMWQFPKVKVVHTPKREGLIRARLVGVEHATGVTVTFLDSHCECNIGWMEPLLARIAEDRSHVVTPIIDMINMNTFAYHKGSVLTPTVGSFSWGMTFRWGSLTKAEKASRSNHTAPARSPTMAGGLFTIHREYFHHIGLYDMGMEIWGGENLELSFRIWMCGGTLEVIPCSRVGHIFRTVNPNLKGIKGSPVHRNTLRLVEIWLDEYKYIYYEVAGRHKSDYGDIGKRLALKKKLQCKPFSWYMDNIVPDMFTPSKAIKHGLLQNEYTIMNHEFKCLDHNHMPNRTNVEQAITWTCNSSPNQRFYLTKHGEIRLLELCMDYAAQRKELTVIKCHGAEGNQKWEYTKGNQIKHSSGQCLVMARNGSQLTMQDCANIKEERWIWVDLPHLRRYS